MEFSPEEKKQMLAMARWSIEAYPESRSDELYLDRLSPNPALSILCGCFVSVYVKEQLRGCIGTFSEESPLPENIRRMAISAAFHDNRFEPVHTDEYQDMLIEISVLSPRRRIQGPDEIEIGRHGIYIISGPDRGTLLPQVAERNGWSAIELLENCSRYKAGLGTDGWMNAELYTYEAIVFTEDEIG